MFIELIATFAAGFAAAGLVLLLNHLLKGRLPRWFMPAAAGAAMIAATIANEYGWFPRTKATLPQGAVIIETVENSSIIRPWTLANPYIERFIAWDPSAIRRNDNHPHLALAELFFFGRWSPTSSATVAVDCREMRRAPMVEGAAFDASGAILGVTWQKPAPEDAILTAICEVL